MARPRIKMSEVIREVYNRTGLPTATIQKILETYSDIVKECVVNEVEVTFNDLGYFGWRHCPKQLNKEYTNFRTGEKEIKDFPAYNVMTFRQKRQWKSEMRELTIPLFEDTEIEGDNI